MELTSYSCCKQELGEAQTRPSEKETPAFDTPATHALILSFCLLSGIWGKKEGRG